MAAVSRRCLLSRGLVHRKYKRPAATPPDSSRSRQRLRARFLFSRPDSRQLMDIWHRIQAPPLLAAYYRKAQPLSAKQSSNVPPRNLAVLPQSMQFPTASKRCRQPVETWASMTCAQKTGRDNFHYPARVSNEHVPPSQAAEHYGLRSSLHALRPWVAA